MLRLPTWSSPPGDLLPRLGEHRLLVESEIKPAGGIVGAGFDEFRWPRSVRPGDELRLQSEVLDVRASKSRPEQGPIKLRTTTLSQNGDAVQILIANLVVPRRPA